MDNVKKIVWVTDIHLNNAHEEKIKSFCRKIVSHNPSAVIMTGDLSEAPTLEMHLRQVEMLLGEVPIYFVCGNHDYYYNSVASVRKMLKKHFNTDSSTVWLPNAGVVTLSKDVALIGHDGWYDGGYGNSKENWMNSKVIIPDYHYIKDLTIGSNFKKEKMFDYIQTFANQGAKHFRKYLKKAFANHNKVFLATHVAPFEENSCAPTGKRSDKDWMPHFVSKASGEAILETMAGLPETCELTVLCGHNHTRAESRLMPNVLCITGKARYRYPDISQVFEI